MTACQSQQQIQIDKQVIEQNVAQEANYALPNTINEIILDDYAKGNWTEYVPEDDHYQTNYVVIISDNWQTKEKLNRTFINQSINAIPKKYLQGIKTIVIRDQNPTVLKGGYDADGGAWISIRRIDIYAGKLKNDPKQFLRVLFHETGHLYAEEIGENRGPKTTTELELIAEKYRYEIEKHLKDKEIADIIWQ